MRLINAAASKSRVCFVLTLIALYLGLFIYLDGLQFTPAWDEPRFWNTSLQFSQSLIPNLEQLQSYDQLNTPLAFIIFGGLEYLFKGGIFAGRLLNLVLSFTLVLLIGVSNSKSRKTSLLSAAGLLLFPYYLVLSGRLYTDIIAASFVFLGFWFYIQERHILSSLTFVLAIAARQYMVAFPLGIVAYELVATLGKEGTKIRLSWLAPLVALLSIFGWVLLFRGLAPPNAIANQTIAVPSVQKQIWSIAPDSSLYFLACIGLYFVIPEWILFSRKINLRSLLKLKNYILCFAVLVLILIFPPLQAYGLLIRVIEVIPGFYLKLALLYGLVLLTAIRFASLNLGFWLVLMNAGVMIKAFPLDKYLIPLLVVLWYLRSVMPEQVGAEVDRPSNSSQPAVE